MTQVARELGIGADLLYSWKRREGSGAMQMMFSPHMGPTITRIRVVQHGIAYAVDLDDDGVPFLRGYRLDAPYAGR